MSICYNKERKKYYISYKIKQNDGSYKTYNIYNKEWNKSVGKRYVQEIEQEEIEKDIKKRKLSYHLGSAINIQELNELYLNEIKSTLKTQTAYNKSIIIKKYITSFFSDKVELVQAFNFKEIERFRDMVVNAPDISAHRKNVIIKLLLEMLEYASDHEYISFELYRKCKVILKPVREQNTSCREDIVFWDNEQWNAFISTFEANDKWMYLFKTAYVCGLRIGELIALKWSDFNASNKTISITKSMDASGKVEDAKTKSSHANVSVSNELVDDLRKLKELLYGDKDSCIGDEYMFFGYHHTSRSTIRRVMDEHASLAKIPHIKFHGLRHSCASRLINAGVSPLIVSKHLRHSSVKETLDTYSHIFPNETLGYIDNVFK